MELAKMCFNTGLITLRYLPHERRLKTAIFRFNRILDPLIVGEIKARYEKTKSKIKIKYASHIVTGGTVNFVVGSLNVRKVT